MSGNVEEWVWDWKEEYPSGKRINPLTTDPYDVKEVKSRILRGGSFENHEQHNAVYTRHEWQARRGRHTQGFRIVRTLKQLSQVGR